MKGEKRSFYRKPWRDYSKKEKALYLLSAFNGLKPRNNHYMKVKARLIEYLKETGGLDKDV